MENLKLKDLFEKRAKVGKQMTDLYAESRDKGTDITPEKKAEYEKWEKEFDEFSEQIKFLEAAEKKVAEISTPINDPPFPELKAVKESKEERDMKEYRDFEDLLRYGEKGLSPERLAEIRANQFYVTGGTKGGYTIPTLVGDKIADAKKYVGGMVDPRVAYWFNSSTGATQTFPKVDDTAVKGYVIAEKTDQATSASDMTFGQATLTFYKITSGLVRAGSELLQDSVFDFAGWLTDMLVKRMYRALNYYFTRGSGTAMPYGIKAISYKGADSTKRGVTRTNLLDLAYSVNRAYQRNGIFQFNNSTMSAIRVLYLEKADSYHLWQPATVQGEMDKLEGWPFIVNDDLESLHPTYTPIYFGDFKNFYIGEALPMKVIRLDELFAGTDEVGFVIHGRWAANLVASDYPIKHIRCATT